MHGRPIIIVSGLPRSGTSMMMKMLDAGGVPVWTDGRRAADDQNPHGYYELERVKDLDKPLAKTWLRDGRGRAIKVISSLLEELPDANNYRVLFMNRDLDEVLSSQRKMLARRREPDSSGDEQLRAAYEAHLGRVKLFLSSAAAFETLHLGYGDVLRDPATTARNIAAFLEADLRLDRMAAAVDPSLYRNRAST
jgi:hypothetical protein